MKDIIPTKVHKRINGAEELKRKFQEKNSSLSFGNEIDSLARIDFKTPEFIDLHSRINIINRFIFNFLAFASMVLSVFLIIIILSIASEAMAAKNKILSKGNAGLESLNQAKDSILKFDLEKSSYYFKSASRDFEEASSELSRKKILTASISIIPIIGDYQQNAKEIIQAGQSISQMGLEVTDILNSKNENALSLFQKAESHKNSITQELESAETSINKINTKILDKKMAGEIENIKSFMPQIKEYLELFNNFYQKIPEIAGFSEEKNYLIVFQNNNELRSAGGFIGSFGILKLRNGEMKEFFVDDIYKLDNNYAGAIAEELTPYIPPPFPMNPQFTGNWTMRDANLNPDFKESAKTIIDFYQKEIPFSIEKKYPERIDGVIGITPTVLSEILKITGPINLEGYDKTISSDNLLETLQIEVEAGKDKQNNQNPKTVLEVLKNKLIERFSSLKPEEIKELIYTLVSKLDEKHILVYFQNKGLEDLAKELKWTGEINNGDNEDFLMVVNNNFGGGKSSLKVDESIEQEVNIGGDGSITKNIKITREHTSGYYLKYFDPWTKQEMWLIGDNNNYTKIYVPKGSQLIKAEGFEGTIDIYNEGDKTAFGSWFSLVPKQKKTASLSYKLPFKTNDEQDFKYYLLMQKQPGSLGSKIQTRISLPEKAKIKITSGNLEKKEDSLFFGVLSIDRNLYIRYSF